MSPEIQKWSHESRSRINNLYLLTRPMPFFLPHSVAMTKSWPKQRFSCCGSFSNPALHWQWKLPTVLRHVDVLLSQRPFSHSSASVVSNTSEWMYFNYRCTCNYLTMTTIYTSTLCLKGQGQLSLPSLWGR